MQTVVTGGAGFLGSTLCRNLLGLGYHVTCLDDLSSGREMNIASLIGNKDFKFIRHNVVNPLPDLDADFVFNLACPASPVQYQADPLQTAKTAAIGTLNALHLAHMKGAKFLQASTSEVYGDPEVHPQVESYWGNVSSTGPRSCYDEGKRFGESLCFDYRRVHGMDVKVVRIFNTYGPRMRASDGRVVSNFVVQALRGQPITIYGDGSQTRSFCYVSDLIDAIIAVHKTGPDVSGPFNIGNPQEISILELAETIQKLVGSNLGLVLKEEAEDDPRRRKPDISAVTAETGWKPVVSLSDGLEKTIAHFRKVVTQMPTNKPNLNTLAS